jgi:hypothetical protein
MRKAKKPNQVISGVLFPYLYDPHGQEIGFYLQVEDHDVYLINSKELQDALRCYTYLSVVIKGHYKIEKPKKVFVVEKIALGNLTQSQLTFEDGSENVEEVAA